MERCHAARRQRAGPAGSWLPQPQPGGRKLCLALPHFQGNESILMGALVERLGFGPPKSLHWRCGPRWASWRLRQPSAAARISSF